MTSSQLHALANRDKEHVTPTGNVAECDPETAKRILSVLIGNRSRQTIQLTEGPPRH